MYVCSCPCVRQSWESSAPVVAKQLLGRQGLGDFTHVVYALSKDFALSGLRVGALYTESQVHSLGPTAAWLAGTFFSCSY